MMRPPSDIEKNILQVIEEAGAIRGSALRRRARIEDPAQRLEAVHNLVNQQLIAVTGGVINERAARESYFSLVPSTRNLARQAVEGR